MTKKIVTTLLIILVLLLNMTIVRASDFEFKATCDKEELKPGEEVIITMSIDNIDVERGINVIEAWLEYDENIFENVEMQNINDWETTYNTESGEREGKFLILKMTEGQTEKEDVGKIKLKVKNDIKSQETEVKISKITSNDGTDLIDEGERIIKFKINNENKPDDGDNDNPGDDDKEKPGDSSDNGDNETSGDLSDYSDKEIPDDNNKPGSSTNNVNTGDITIAVSVTIIAAVIIINLIIFIIRKNKKKKEQKEKND